MPIRIRRPRNLSKFQLAIGLALGVLSGAYIYQPYFIQQRQLKQDQLKLEAEKIATNTTKVTEKVSG